MTVDYPLHRPELGFEEAAALAEVLASGQLVQGPRVAAFEAAVAQRLALPCAVACSSGTAALHLALAALDVGPGDEVIVPAFGFPATANVVELCGARAVPADVDLDRFALTAESVAAVATERTRGVLVVHPFGIPAPMAALSALAQARGWWLVEDAACALGTAPRQDDAARWASGDHLVCLSFHPRKTLTTAEGGMVLTADPALAHRLRRLRNHGMDEPAPGDGRWQRFHAVGFNYRMSELHAALGQVQMTRLDAIVAGRARLAAWYREALAALPRVSWPAGYQQPDLAFQSLVVLLDPEIDRDQVIDRLAGRGVQTTLGGYALALQPAYRGRPDADPARLPNASRAQASTLTLPATLAMTQADVEVVVDALADALADAQAPARRSTP